MQERWLALPARAEEPHITAHNVCDERSGAWRLCDAVADDPPDGGSVQFRRLAQHRETALDLPTVAQDRLVGGAAMTLQPCLVGLKRAILMFSATRLREDVPVTKKSEESPGTSTASRWSTVADQRSTLAVHRAATIMAGVLCNVFDCQIWPA